MNTFDLLTAGYLSRNRFWGEDESKPYRGVLCTSTLIRTSKHTIVVDPSQDPEIMTQSLFNKSGLKPSDIDIVYITHQHADHYVGLETFGRAESFMAAKDLQYLRENGTAEEKGRIQNIKPAADNLCEGISIIPLPGHTLGLAGLLFEAPEGKVLLSGDCIMTKDFFKARCPYFFCKDSDLNIQSINAAASLADIIVPGHGSYFLVKAY
jgi:glyoxylase-like metal-dependent hydrolase (beta-lactamase superfamily II)